MPVELFPATRSEHVPLRMLAADGTPLARRYFCSKDDRRLEDDDIVRGFELDGKYVVVTDEELEALEPEKSRDIDLRRFVERDAIDPRFFERAYFLTPGGGSTKAYRLLAETMERTGRAGIATFVMRGKEYFVAILAEDGILRAETMRFLDELRSASDIELPAVPRLKKTDTAKVDKAIRGLSKQRFDPRELEDPSTARLVEIALDKQRKGENVVTAPESAETPADADVIDLMQIIKRGMKSGRSKRPTRRPASAARRRRATTPPKRRKPAARKGRRGGTSGR